VTLRHREVESQPRWEEADRLPTADFTGNESGLGSKLQDESFPLQFGLLAKVHEKPKSESGCPQVVEHLCAMQVCQIADRLDLQDELIVAREIRKEDRF
jgi:hypothetical protein